MTDLSIVILNHERYPHLKRLLNYYNTFGLKINIVVLDSSKDKSVDDELKRLLDQDNIIWRKYDSSNFFEKLAHGIQYIKTKYSVLCPVDDFIIPSALVKCIEFLEKHPNYSCVQGLFIKHWLFEKDGNIKFNWTPRDINMASNNYNHPENRVYAYLSNLSGGHQFYGVHRSEVLKLIWKETAHYAQNLGWGEYFSGCLSLIYGKRKILPVFYLSRETHTSLPLKREDLEHAFFSNMLTAINGLANNLAIINKVSYNEAKEQLKLSILAKIKIKISPEPIVSANKKIKYIFNIQRSIGKIKLGLVNGGLKIVFIGTIIFLFKTLISVLFKNINNQLLKALENKSEKILRSMYKDVMMRKDLMFKNEFIKLKQSVIEANIDPTIDTNSRLGYTVE